MPELPEVEILTRHLAPVLAGKTIHAIEVRRAKIIAPTGERSLRKTLLGATFVGVTRRGKFLLFGLRAAGPPDVFTLVGHLGMTGRMYMQPRRQAIARHAAVILNLGAADFVFEDPRGFGRLTLDRAGLERLGPEPFADEFDAAYFSHALRRSSQPIKVKMLDQSLVAGIGNIYASEALFRADISPGVAARKLSDDKVKRLWQAIRDVLAEAIRFGSTVPLDWAGTGGRNRLFYYGRAGDATDGHTERLRVYDRAGKPCPRCGGPIKRIVQAARSTFYCPVCQSPPQRRQSTGSGSRSRR